MSLVVPPTLDQFKAYQGAWAYFNKVLFGNTLEPCLLNFSRHRGANGFFSPRRWAGRGKVIHEISLNPDLLHRTIEETFGTLCHEMGHQWQQDHGEPPRKAYHDREWASKMKEVGLIPSSTGKPGGKQTGQGVTHYPDPNGKFVAVVKTMPREIMLPWLSAAMGEEKKPKKPSTFKFKYTCPRCDTKITSEHDDLEIQCVGCEELFELK